MPATGTSASVQAVPKAKMSSGSIIAIAVAVVIAAIVLLASILVGLICWRRKRPQNYGDDDPTSNLGRNTSVLSKAGLLGTATSVQNPSETTGQSSAPMSERRSSRLQVYDQRLNPVAFMQHDDASRSSFVSMQDNRDYTRTLNVSIQRHIYGFHVC
jgi:cell wall integrity and stress response component